MHDHLSNAISHQQVSCLCLFDLSAAFDTLDHSILLSIVGSAHLLFLFSGSPHICRLEHLPLPFHLIFSLHPITCMFPQDSVLSPIFVNLYITPLSSLISSSTVSHLFYSDDTQLIISFIPTNFSLAFSDLQSTIVLISSWMSTNYLTLNPSKTEFLLIDFSRQILQ